MLFGFTTELLTNYGIVVLLFFVVAILYSSVGFGGGSSYLAILTLTPLLFTQIKTTALLCNIVVVLGNSILYQKNKVIPWKKTIPIIASSLPLAFLGGFLRINETLFYIILGITLLIAAIIMFFSKKKNDIDLQENNLPIYKNVTYGSGIGFISGLVGIGGGIFLAPLLHFTKWSSSKKIAATASVFILVNSIAGLLGQIANSNFKIDNQLTPLLLITVFIGGKIGSNLSNNVLSSKQIKFITAILIAIVGIRLLNKHILL